MTPNPGSDEAGALGCVCPVLDNCHGKFAPYPPDGWVIHFGCPVHCPVTDVELAAPAADGDFYEDDELAEDVVRAFESAETHLTAPTADDGAGLWAVHVETTDDLIAATDRAHAEAIVAQINEIATLLRNRPDASDADPILRAVVIPSPWSPEEHAEVLAYRPEEYTP